MRFPGTLPNTVRTRSLLPMSIANTETTWTQEKVELEFPFETLPKYANT